MFTLELAVKLMLVGSGATAAPPEIIAVILLNLLCKEVTSATDAIGKPTTGVVTFPDVGVTV